MNKKTETDFMGLVNYLKKQMIKNDVTKIKTITGVEFSLSETKTCLTCTEFYYLIINRDAAFDNKCFLVEQLPYLLQQIKNIVSERKQAEQERQREEEELTKDIQKLKELIEKGEL